MTQMWVLILSMMGGSGSGIAIDHIHGFASQQECEVAARKWLAGFDHLTSPKSAICVEQAGAAKAVAH